MSKKNKQSGTYTVINLNSKSTFMNNKILILLILFTTSGINGYSENDGKGTPNIKKNFFIDLGGAYGDFQDTKFSDVRESGFGGMIKLGYNNLKDGKHFWEAGLVFNATSENTSTHDRGSSYVLYPNLYGKYLCEIDKNLYVGTRIDAFDMYSRIYTNLNNNSTFAVVGNHLYASVIYQVRINGNWKFRATGDLALISFQNESTSFGMSYSPNRIDRGEVDYQDPNMGDPSDFKYYKFKYIGNNFILKTEYAFMLKKRFSFSYNWEIRRFSVVDGYPTTIGMHNIAVRFNIIHREKQK